jgi:hypothetical protein
MNKKFEELITFLFALISSIIVIVFILTLLLILIFKENNAVSIGIAIISAIGSVVGGSLTLIGVWWTIQESKKETVKKKNAKTFFVFSRLYPYIEGIQNSVKSINPKNISDYLDILENQGSQLVREIEKVLTNLEDIDYGMLQAITSAEYYGNYLLLYIKNIKPGETDDQIFLQLNMIRNNFAIIDEQFGDFLLMTRNLSKNS